MAIKLNEIGQVHVNVHDLARATAFYRDTLGLPFMFEAGGMAFFMCGGVRVMLGTASEDAYDHPSSILYFRTEGIEETAEALKKDGVSFESEPHLTHRDDSHELWMAFFHDPEGNVMALMEEKPLEAAE